MIKKISVFALLLSLLLALGVPLQAKAEEDETSIFFNRSDCRLYDDNGISIELTASSKSAISNGSSVFVWIQRSTNCYYVYVYFYDSQYQLCYFNAGNHFITFVQDGEFVLKEEYPNCYQETYVYYLSSDDASAYFDLDYSYHSLNLKFTNSGFFNPYSHIYGSRMEIIYFESDILLGTYDSNDIYLTGNYYLTMPVYDFESWCADAGLNCSASSNESDSVVPFWYEPDNYNYIVRKTLTASSTSGVYQMTMLQKTDGAHYPYYFEVNDIGYLGVAGAFSDISTFTVRNFYYDAEGNGWKLIERFDVSTLPFDNTNVYFTDDVVFIYSDTDIYANREASSIWQAASTEYYNVDIPEPDAPTPTPTTVPSSGAGRPGSGTRPDTGGEATGGGGLDFIINLFTLIWQKICSIPMAVDGYSISLQQIFVYGALVSIVGGFIIRFIFRR